MAWIAGTDYCEEELCCQFEQSIILDFFNKSFLCVCWTTGGGTSWSKLCRYEFPKLSVCACLLLSWPLGHLWLWSDFWSEIFLACSSVSAESAQLLLRPQGFCGPSVFVAAASFNRFCSFPHILHAKLFSRSSFIAVPTPLSAAFKGYI